MLSTLAAGFLTLLGPLMASWHYMGLIVARFLTGLCGVPTTKNNHQELFNSMVVGSDLPLSSLSSVALGTSRRERQIHRGPSRWYSWNHGDLAPLGLHHRESRLVLVVLHQWRDCSGVVRFLDFASCWQSRSTLDHKRGGEIIHHQELGGHDQAYQGTNTCKKRTKQSTPSCRDSPPTKTFSFRCDSGLWSCSTLETCGGCTFWWQPAPTSSRQFWVST